jgi:hypothetical protein
MARTRLWSVIITGLVEVAGASCTSSDPPALRAQEPLMLVQWEHQGHGDL